MRVIEITYLKLKSDKSINATRNDKNLLAKKKHKMFSKAVSPKTGTRIIMLDMFTPKFARSFAYSRFISLKSPT